MVKRLVISQNEFKVLNINTLSLLLKVTLLSCLFIDVLMVSNILDDHLSIDKLLTMIIRDLKTKFILDK